MLNTFLNAICSYMVCTNLFCVYIILNAGKTYKLGPVARTCMYILNVSDFEVAKLIPDSWFRNPVLVSVSFRVSVRNEFE